MKPETLFKQLRTQSGFSQNRLSVKAGYDHSYVSRIESGSRKPTPEALESFIEAMGFSGEDAAYELMHAYGYVTDRHILAKPLIVKIHNRCETDENFSAALQAVVGGIL